MKKLNGIKKENDDKLEELQEKVKESKSLNIKLSETLNDLHIEMRVRKIQQISFSNEKKLDEIEVKMQEVDQELKGLDLKSKF